MAFKKENITPYANNGKRGRAPILWEYYNEDGDDITVAGYFKYGGEYSDGDIVLAIAQASTSIGFYSIGGTQNKILTLTAVAVTTQPEPSSEPSE
jgi:hypothetical protein